MATSQTAKSILYIDCWKHHNSDSLTYWNGSVDVNVPIPGCEISISLQALNANDVFDVLYTASGACLPTNGSGAGWSGDILGSLTARGAGYSEIDEAVRGYPTNANSIAHCYNGSTDYGPVAANRGALIGSICTDAAGKVSFTRGSKAPGGGAARLCVWNVDDEPLITEVTDSGPNWTFLGYVNSGTIIDIENLDNGSNGGLGNRVTFLSGLPRHSPLASMVMSFGTSAAFGPCNCAIGFSMDHSGPNDSPDRVAEHLSPLAGIPAKTNTAIVALDADGIDWQLRSTGIHQWEPVVGMHYVQAQEMTDGVQRCWFRTVGGQRSGLTFELQM